MTRGIRRHWPTQVWTVVWPGGHTGKNYSFHTESRVSWITVAAAAVATQCAYKTMILGHRQQARIGARGHCDIHRSLSILRRLATRPAVALGWNRDVPPAVNTLCLMASLHNFLHEMVKL
jgi:hypothetical protein